MAVLRKASPYERARLRSARSQPDYNKENDSQQQEDGRSTLKQKAYASTPSLRRSSQPTYRTVPNDANHNSESYSSKTQTRPSPYQVSPDSDDFNADHHNSESGARSLSGQSETPDAEDYDDIDLSRPAQRSANNSLRQLSRPFLTSSRSSWHSAPKSVRDLGSDYTRYYNPFASRNFSDGHLNVPFPVYNVSRLMATPAVSSPDLERRLIDPLSRPETATTMGTASNEHHTPTLRAKRSSLDIGSSTPSSSAESALKAEDAFLIEIPDTAFDVCPPYIDDRLNAPCALPLFTDEKEDDDEMHLPRWDDDVKYKAHWRDHCSCMNVINSIGGILVVLGLMCVFVALPVISWTGTSILDYPYDSPNQPAPIPWTHVNDRSYPLLQNVRTGLIDPDTPSSAMTRKSVSGEDLVLVFSDEFNERNRTFYPGDDPYWFAPDIWYSGTQDLEWYDPDAVNTGGGTLQIQLDEFANHGLDYRSGMLNSWNQLCFKGGVFEVSASLPGPAGVHGLWPGIWTMGNLGRPGYLATTDGLWPYTYNDCDAGITPNQSMTDGISFLPGQRLPSCPCADADHPTPGTGRGAPEIDIAEVSADYGGLGYGVATQSFQVAPFDIWYYPNYDFMETPNYNVSFVNTYTGGPFQQAVSTTSMLNNAWYDGREFQKFAYEYTPGAGANASITWFIGDDETMAFDARAIGPNGNVGQRLVSEEPMSMILNLGFSHSWTYIEFADLKFPTVLQIDYVRWYQPRDAQMVSCDPPGFETTRYIAEHPVAYNNPNLTKWADTGYGWPENTLMHGCAA